eukprot:scaffold61296_cov14-Tisochrysis_lutea.AAC.1
MYSRNLICRSDQNSGAKGQHEINEQRQGQGSKQTAGSCQKTFAKQIDHVTAGLDPRHLSTATTSG